MMHSVSIAGQQFCWLRHAGPDCQHDVLLRAGCPASPNWDQAAQDAADAFTDSALAHLRAWWEGVRLPALCRAAHTVIAGGEVAREEHADDAGHDSLHGPGFRWVEAWIATDPDGRLILGSTPSGPRSPHDRAPARLRAYLLTDDGAAGDLGDEGSPPGTRP